MIRLGHGGPPPPRRRLLCTMSEDLEAGQHLGRRRQVEFKLPLSLFCLCLVCAEEIAALADFSGKPLGPRGHFFPSQPAPTWGNPRSQGLLEEGMERGDLLPPC